MNKTKNTKQKKKVVKKRLYSYKPKEAENREQERVQTRYHFERDKPNKETSRVDTHTCPLDLFNQSKEKKKKKRRRKRNIEAIGRSCRGICKGGSCFSNFFFFFFFSFQEDVIFLRREIIRDEYTKIG